MFPSHWGLSMMVSRSPSSLNQIRSPRLWCKVRNVVRCFICTSNVLAICSTSTKVTSGSFSCFKSSSLFSSSLSAKYSHLIGYLSPQYGCPSATLTIFSRSFAQTTSIFILHCIFVVQWYFAVDVITERFSKFEFTDKTFYTLWNIVTAFL